MGMYDSSIKSETIPLAMPTELLVQIRRAAKTTGLSMADTMRQSMRSGLPKLVEELSPLKGFRALTAEECRRCWEQPNPEFDAVESEMAKRHFPPPEE